MGSEKSPSFVGLGEMGLTAESVQGTSLTLQSVDHIHGGHGLPLSVLGVGDGITDDVLEEHLQDTAGLLVDETGDTLHTTTASQAADGGLGDALDVITQYFAVTLGASLSESFTTFSTSRHVDSSMDKLRMSGRGKLRNICTFHQNVRMPRFLTFRSLFVGFAQ